VRFLLNAATALSAVLAVATAGLWVRSYWLYDSLGVQLGRADATLRAEQAGNAVGSRRH